MLWRLALPNRSFDTARRFGPFTGQPRLWPAVRPDAAASAVVDDLDALSPYSITGFWSGQAFKISTPDDPSVVDLARCEINHAWVHGPLR